MNFYSAMGAALYIGTLTVTLIMSYALPSWEAGRLPLLIAWLMGIVGVGLILIKTLFTEK